MKHSFLLCISLIFAFTTSPSSHCNGLMRKLNSETDPVALTCRKTTDFGFCTYTLRSDPRSKGASTDGLAHIAADMLQGHATDTSKYLQELQKKGGDPKVKAVVDTCVGLYGPAADKDVPSVIRSLNSKAYGDAVNAASAALKAEEGCRDGVTKSPSPDLQMVIIKNKYMQDLSKMSIDLIGLIGK